MIYLDNAATTLHKPPYVVRAVAEAMTSLGNSARGVHGGSLAAARTIFSCREKVAALFGLDDPQRVIFTQNSTMALNIAISGLFSPGDHILSTDLEHNSVLRPLYQIQDQDVEVEFLPADRAGRIDYGDLEKRLRPNTRAVVCTHASNLTGDVVDLKKIGAFTRKYGLLFVVDASQTAGQLPIDMKQLGISVLCFTGHKGLMGPQGTGGLCIARDVDIRPLLTGGSGVQTYLPYQPREYPARLEAGTLNGHGIAGLSAALDFITETGLDTIHAHEDALARRFYAGVKNLPGVTVYGDQEAAVRCPIVTLNIAGMDSGEVADVLFTDYDIAVRAGAHCAPRLHRALGTEETGAVRFSFGWGNTEAEVDAAIQAVKELAEG